MDRKNRERFLIVVAMISFGALLGDAMILSPLRNLWTDRSKRIATLEERLEKGRLLVGRKDSLFQRWDAMKRIALPIEQSIAEEKVLESIDRWAQESGFSVKSLKPRWNREEEGYKTLEFRVSADGDVESLWRFLYEIENEPLALKLENIEIAAADKTGKKLDLSLRFTGLLLLDEEI